eukprot:TRINITY_DN5260_c0_g1_i1.p1 TRINITY_DN5260_c0_g1~~TRINITY_DN5260_c0_g1_i1.p1  ORF type:complete len:1052 (+),score=491.14 TRINITY_DN5260_c0_g1_i1:62-3157(+)
MAGPANENGFDEQLYNRQTYAIGADAQARLGRTDVLVCGVTGLGQELVKNIMLTGVRSVALFDPRPVEWRDLAAAFYFTDAAVGSNRVDACLEKLQELNKYCAVSKLDAAELTEEKIAEWKAASLARHAESQQVVVYVDHPTSQLTAVNEYCRTNGVKFIAAESRGLAGSIFVDNGPAHTVFDTDGEEVKTLLVTHLGNAVIVHDDHRHELSDGHTVMFTDLPEFPEMHNESLTVAEPKYFQVKVTGPFSFTLEKDGKPYDTTGFKYVRGGYVTRVKQPESMPFLSLAESIAAPEFLTTDFAKLEAPATLHQLFLALHEYEKQHGRAPAPHNAADAEAVLALVKANKAKFPDVEVDEALVKLLASTAWGNLNPMAGVLGGFAAHEVLKAASGKFTPIKQWFYMDARECLPEALPAADQCQPQNNRYDGTAAVFGREFLQRVQNGKYFVVGCGALGCEFLKNLAMVGAGCGADGSVVVTDMDAIEKSNLSRQLLYRPADIGCVKSEVAAKAAQALNPDIHVKALTERVCPETDHIFDDGFWESMDCVINALDNVQARLHVDAKCVYYRKPLLESGTLGSKGNVQVVYPFVTESYGSTRDPPEKTVPFCTLKNFPNAIEHTIQWSRDQFEGLFTNAPRDANCYITEDNFLEVLAKEPSTRIPTLLSIRAALTTDKPATFEDCVAWARRKFDEMFSNDIRTLLHNFPLDQTTTSGEPFWSGAKRPPQVIEFSPNDATHCEFVYHAAMLRAFNYNIKPTAGIVEVATFAASLAALPWVAKKVKIQTDEKAKADAPEVDETASPEEIAAHLPPRAGLTGSALQVAEFEKDDDTNHHIDFITACSNLRARNYKIPEADRNRTKQIAGKIIPAMVTTTALVTGLVGFELFKVLQKGRKIEDFKNAFLNLAIPFVTLSEPGKAPENTYGNPDAPTKWTLWDRFDVDEGKDITLAQFIDLFEERHELEISMISAGVCTIYAFFQKQAEKKKRLGTKLSELVAQISKQALAPNQKYINMEVCADYDGETADVPSIRYKFRN